MAILIKYLDSSYNDKKEIDKLINKAYKVNKNFFEKDIKENNIEIIIVYNRNQFDNFNERKTEKWEVGYTFGRNNKVTIVIFSQSVFEKISNHPKSDFSSILIHEFAHVFTGYILHFYYPKWLHEGIAGYIAKQYKSKILDKDKILSLSKLHDKTNWYKNPNYPEAFLFTKFLFDKFGKDKMLEFLTTLKKSLDKYHSYKDFENYFNKYFEHNLNRIFKEWKLFLVK